MKKNDERHKHCLVRYGSMHGSKSRWVAIEDNVIVMQSDFKSQIIAEAQRRNGYDPIDGSEQTYGLQLTKRGLW